MLTLIHPQVYIHDLNTVMGVSSNATQHKKNCPKIRYFSIESSKRTVPASAFWRASFGANGQPDKLKKTVTITISISIAPKSPRFYGDLQSMYKTLKITSKNFQIYKHKTSTIKRGKNVYLKKQTWVDVFNLFLKILTEEEFVNSRRKEFHSFGAQPENARSPYVFKEEKSVASRYDKDHLRSRAGEYTDEGKVIP